MRGVALEADGTGQVLVADGRKIKVRERLDLRAGVRYDVVGTPSLMEDRIVLAVRDARETEGAG